MRLDAVEIKVTIDAPDAARAVDAFAPMPRPRERTVWFCEDVATATAAEPLLLDAHVVLRARTTRGSDDSTIKLRPGRRSQLTEHWLATTGGDGAEFTIEADWAGQRKVLAASYTADLPDGSIARVAADHEPIAALFTPQQRQLLAECADIRINLDAITLLPPIGATRWGPFAADPATPELKVMAERWTVDELDFFELSVRVDDVDSAENARARLEDLVRSRGFTVNPLQETKTRRVVQHLVGKLVGT